MIRKILYTRDNKVSLVIPAQKCDLERILGPLTQEQYEKHIWDCSIPSDALNARYIEESDIPTTREFREAWCDQVMGTQIDICLSKAKELKLAEMRKARDALLDVKDKEFMKAFELNDSISLERIKKEKQVLRDITEPLKALVCEGYNDAKILQQIKDLSNV